MSLSPSPFYGSQARKNAFDVGEYGTGYCTNSLSLGCDCLGLIKYFDGHLCTSRQAQSIFSMSIILLVTHRVYSRCLTFYWSHTEYILDV